MGNEAENTRDTYPAVWHSRHNGLAVYEDSSELKIFKFKAQSKAWWATPTKFGSVFGTILT